MKPGRSRLRILAIASAAVLIFLRYGNGHFLPCDSLGYFGYLPALVFEGHLDFTAYFAACGCHPSLTPTGLATNFWSPGVSLLWFPFFLTGVVFFKVMGFPLVPYCRYPVFFMTNSGTFIYGLAAIALTAGILRRLGLSGTRWKVILPAVFGTPFFYYMTLGAAMPHVLSAFAICAFAWACLSDDAAVDPPWQAFLLGLLAGLAVLVREENVVWLVLLVFPIRRMRAAVPGGGWRPMIPWAALFGFGCLVMLSPRLLAWNALYGNPLASPKAPNLAANRFVLHEVLFSPFHGLLFWNPIMLLAMAGYAFAWRHPKREEIMAFGSCFLLQVVICGFLESWWGWYAFGYRVLTSAFLPVSVGLLCPLVALKSKRLASLVIACYAAAALWTVGLFVNHDMGRLNLGVFVAPGELGRLQAGLLRDPIGMLKAIVSLPPLFWPGFWLYAGLGSMMVAAAMRTSRHWQRYRIKLVTSLVALNASVFLGLMAGATHGTVTREFSEAEKRDLVFTRDELEYMLFHGRLTEIGYLIDMGRLKGAEELFKDTMARYAPTKAWRMLEKQNGRPISQDQLRRQFFKRLPMTR
jgi:hypothetical protein